MANVDSPFGAKPVWHLLGLDWTGCIRPYYVGSGDSTAIYKYDLVKLAGSADATGLYPDIAQAAAGDSVLGSAVGFSTTPYVSVDPTNLERKYRPASTAMYVWVVDDPYVIYEMQEDSGGAALAVTAISLNTNIVVGSGNTTSGASGMELDSSDTGTDSTGQMRILRLVPRADNVLGDHAKWLCLINEHQLRGTADV
jgi:hypothetical protein